MSGDSNTSEAVESQAASDWAIVQRVQKGETDAFEILVRRHQKPVFNLAYRMLGDYEEATEASQEIFLSAFRALNNFRGESSFSTWIFRIGLNHAGGRRQALALRRKREEPLGEAEPVGRAFPDPVKFVEMQQNRSLVQAALNKLSREHCEIITLIDLQGETYENAADIAGIKVETVKTRLHRARLALKAQLAPIFKERRSR